MNAIFILADHQREPADLSDTVLHWKRGSAGLGADVSLPKMCESSIRALSWNIASQLMCCWQFKPHKRCEKKQNFSDHFAKLLLSKTGTLLRIHYTDRCFPTPASLSLSLSLSHTYKKTHRNKKIETMLDLKSRLFYFWPWLRGEASSMEAWTLFLVS